MSLKEQLSVTERELGQVSQQIGKLSKSSKVTLSNDQVRIQSCLRSAVRTIHGVHSSLLIEKESIDSFPGAFPVDDDEENQPSSLNSPLKELDRVSSQSLEHVSEYFRNAHDLNAKLESIDTTSRQHADTSDSQLRRARLEVLTQQKDQQIAKQHLEECHTEMTELSAKMEKTSDKRDGLRVGRVLMWGAALAYPPAAIVAAGMEVGAHKIRKKTRELQEKKATLDARNTAFHQEVTELGQNIKELQSNVQLARKLSQRCQTLSKDLKKYLVEIEDMMRKFLDLKMASDNFASSTRLWKDQAEMIKEVSDDEEGVKRLTQRLLEDIDQSQKLRTLNKFITSKGMSEDRSMSVGELLGLPTIEPLMTTKKHPVLTQTVELTENAWAL